MRLRNAILILSPLYLLLCAEAGFLHAVPSFAARFSDVMWMFNLPTLTLFYLGAVAELMGLSFIVRKAWRIPR